MFSVTAVARPVLVNTGAVVSTVNTTFWLSTVLLAVELVLLPAASTLTAVSVELPARVTVVAHAPAALATVVPSTALFASSTDTVEPASAVPLTVCTRLFVVASIVAIDGADGARVSILKVREAEPLTLPAASRATTVTVRPPWPNVVAASATVTDHAPVIASAVTVCVYPEVLVSVTLEPASAVPEITRSVFSDALTRPLPATTPILGAAGAVTSTVTAPASPVALVLPAASL